MPGATRPWVPATFVFALLAALLPAFPGHADRQTGEWVLLSDTGLREIVTGSDAEAGGIAPLMANGLLQLRSGAFEGSAATFREALSRDDRAAAAHLFLAVALNRQAVVFPLARERISGATPPITGAQTAQDLFAAADRHFETALSLDPADAQAWAAWGEALFGRSYDNPLMLPMHDPLPILAKFRRASALEPDHRRAISGLANTLQSYGIAYRFMFKDHPAPETLADWFPDDIDGQAEIYLLEAAELYQALLAGDPGEQSYYLPAIDTTAGLWRFDRSIELCKLAIDRFPDSRLARAAYERWGAVLDFQDREGGAPSEPQRSEYEDYGSRLGR